MKLTTLEDPVVQTSDLLQSLQASVRSLRKTVEELKHRIENGQLADMGSGSKELAAAEGLLRACQKVETSLVEQRNRQAGIAQGGYALDLEQARFEVGCRLARLRACCKQGRVSD